MISFVAGDAVANGNASLRYAFRNTNDLATIDLSGMTGMSLTTLEFAFAVNTGGPDLTAITFPADWDVSGVTNMNNTFLSRSNLDLDVSDWDVSSVTGAGGFMQGTDWSTTNYDAALLYWSTLSLQTGTNFSADSDTCYTETTDHGTVDGTWGTMTDAGECP